MFPPGLSFIRVLHASGNAPAVDVYLNKIKIVHNLAFRNLSPYQRVRPGRYHLEIFLQGEKKKPIYQRQIIIQRGKLTTLAIINRPSNLSLLEIPDMENPEPIRPRAKRESSYIRFVHLSPNTPAVQVKVENGVTLFNNIRYQGISNYKAVKPATYNLDIISRDTEQSVLQVKNVVIQTGFFYTIYALGLLDGTPPLQAITVLDGIY